MNNNTDILGDFVPKTPRQCNSVAWSTSMPNHLAAGFDKVRQDTAVSIWDINQYRDSSTADPLIELCHGEAAVAIAWAPSLPFTLAVGTSFKWLRLNDTRGIWNRASAPSVMAHNKVVKGVCFNPERPWQLATHSDEGEIKIWDIRKLDVPTIRIKSPKKNLTNIAWSPEGSLAGIAHEEKHMIIWDVGSNDDFESSNEIDDSDSESKISKILVREFRRYTSSTPVAFCWIKDVNSVSQKVLFVEHSGSIETLSLRQPVPMSFSSIDEIAMGDKRAIGTFDMRSLDPSWFIHTRAEQGYSLTPSINIDIITAEILSESVAGETLKELQRLRDLWRWIERATCILEDVNGLVDCGILSLLARRSTQETIVDSKLGMKLYQSSHRNLAAALCGWSDLDGSEFKKGVVPHMSDPEIATPLTYNTSMVVGENNFQRIAMLCVFYCRLKSAVLVLQEAAMKMDDHEIRDLLQLVSMALAGYPTGTTQPAENHALWCDTCISLLERLTGLPILRATLCFLLVSYIRRQTSADLDSEASSDIPEMYSFILGLDNPIEYSCVIQEDAISLPDRISFACRFLPDKQLHSFLLDLCTTVTDAGLVDGIVLTGLGVEGMDLLQAYINRSGDLQTVAVVINFGWSEDKRLQWWNQAYRDLLDRWQLWHHRARFDVAVAGLKNTDSKQPESQLFVVCTHCRESLLLSSMMDDASTGKVNRRKLTLPCCPRCNKRLSSCAVCVLPITCVNPYAQMLGLSRADQKRVNKIEQSKKDIMLNGTGHPFGKWFSWCLTCRHGGHACCLNEWFASHNVCPESDCHCRCNNLS